ncbi:stage V sporulation protein AE [Sulfobacillus harzensis]|uniref:Stage V sporulation protein AE n=1 Tax=Sulfobacillus harzensis TaxID=2729629 RepID=A0A7Y0Q2K5_9FIRM|nr:stage V sporulation protein AE [Sulfobacillus harzensis]NMP22430.1 stage V sporulation protein AE [Sulfobacillus harzensis]
MMFLWAFIIGGLLCVIAQLVMDFGRYTPGQVLVLFVVLGAIAGGIGLYGKLVNFAGAGATVPLPGFGYTMVEGIGQAVREKGPLGLFTGGLTAAAGGIKAAVLFGLAAALIFKPKA